MPIADEKGKTMMRWNSEQQARDEIKGLVAEYYHNFHEKKTEFRPGDRIN